MRTRIIFAVSVFFLATITAFAAPADTVVYITANGKMYHRGSCSSLRQSKIETTLDNAVNRGYSPCSRCNPPAPDRSQSSTPSISKSTPTPATVPENIKTPPKRVASNKDKLDFWTFYGQNKDKSLFMIRDANRNIPTIVENVVTYEFIEDNSIKIVMRFTFKDNDEQMAVETGEAIGRDCLRVMLAWLDKNNLDIPITKESLYCSILSQTGKEYWLVILDEKTKEIVAEKRH